MIEDNKGKKILIFLDTKRDVRKLEQKGILALHGDLNQSQRNYAL